MAVELKGFFVGRRIYDDQPVLDSKPNLTIRKDHSKNPCVSTNDHLFIDPYAPKAAKGFSRKFNQKMPVLLPNGKPDVEASFPD